ncbi:MAG: NHL repeat-containing protein [Planctomycetota bacterium]
MPDSEPQGEPPPADQVPSQEDLKRLGESVTTSKEFGSSLPAAPQFKLICEIGRRSKPPLVQPMTVGLDDQGDILVIEHPQPDRFQIRRFSADGEDRGIITTLAKGDQEAEILDPASVITDGEHHLYVLDAAGGALKKLSPDGRWLDTFPTDAPDGKPLNSPRDVSMDDSGKLYIADTNNDRVVVLSPDGEPAWIIDQFTLDDGEEPEELYEPGCVTPDGQVCVADTNENRVVRFDARRKPIAVVEGEGLFYFPTRVCVSDDGGTLYVADKGTTRVQRFDRQGNKTGSLSIGEGSEATSMQSGPDFEVDAEGHPVMINALRESIVVLSFLEG